MVKGIDDAWRYWIFLNETETMTGGLLTTVGSNRTFCSSTGLSILIGIKPRENINILNHQSPIFHA
jgi:hypothetical protein